jgi:hypothetical protein
MLGLVLATTLVAAASPVIAPGTYTYDATLAGAKVGTSTLIVKTVNGATEIDEHASGAVSGSGGASADATLMLGTDLSPTAYHLSGTSNGSPVKDSATIANSTANVTNVHGQNQSIDLLASTKHFVVVDLGVFAGLLPLPAQMRAWNNAAVLAVVPSIGQSVSLVPSGAAAPTRPATVPATDQSLSFDGQAPFTIWYDPSTNVPDEIDITSQGIVVTRQR